MCIAFENSLNGYEDTLEEFTLKIKEGFMLREIAGTWVVVPIGQSLVDFNGLMTLNESSTLIWKQLETGSDLEKLTSLILSEYDIDENTARSDIQEFITILDTKGLLTNG